MKYQLSIRDSNIKPHLDIEDTIAKQKDGLLTFTVRLNGGNIVDFNITEYVDSRSKYGIVKTIVVEQLVVTSNHRG